jgi:Xaa-Pro aminopeptidase
MKRGRIKKVVAHTGARALDALLINSPENIRYLTGFTGSEAVLLLAPRGMRLIVDARYTSQARDECRGIAIVETKDKIRGAAKCARDLGVKKIGFEPQHVTVEQYGVLENIGSVDLVPEINGPEKVRSIKEPGELKLIKKAAVISSESYRGILKEIKAGTKESEIGLSLEFCIRKRGADRISFPFIVASGKRGALPHGLSTGKRIGEGEFVTVDFGAVYRGYCSDETCTFVVGKPSRKQKRVYQAVKDAHDKAISKVRPGIKAKQIDAAARGQIEKAGLGRYFRHGTGHGVGLAIHEEPKIAPRQEGRIEEGMVFTIEPGVYIPGWGGVRIEDLVVVTSRGCELMSSVPKGLFCV